MWPTPPTSSDSSDSENDVEVVYDGVNNPNSLHQFCNGSCKHHYKRTHRRLMATPHRPGNARTRNPGMDWVPAVEIEEFVNTITRHLASADAQRSIVSNLSQFMRTTVGYPLTLRAPVTGAQAANSNDRTRRQARRVSRLRNTIEREINCAIIRLDPQQSQVFIS